MDLDPASWGGLELGPKIGPVKTSLARHATIICKHICKHNSIKHYIIQHTGNLAAWPPTPSKPGKGEVVLQRRPRAVGLILTLAPVLLVVTV